MLGKLIKYEWKSTYKVGCMMLLGLVLVTMFGWLSFQAPLWQAAVHNEYYESFGIWDLFSVMIVVMYAFMLVGLNYGIIIYLGVRFYKTMYTDEGYLTHTLPVTKHQILVGKIFVSGIWSLIIALGVFVSVMSLMLFMVGAFMPEGYTFAELWEEFSYFWDDFDDMFREIFGTTFGNYSLLMLISVILGPFTTITILFGAISIGQLFTKHRVLMAIVSYVGILIVENLISSAIQSAVSIRQMARSITDRGLVGGYLNVTMFTSLLIPLLLAVGLYVVSYYVTDRRLNME